MQFFTMVLSGILLSIQCSADWAFIRNYGAADVYKNSNGARLVVQAIPNNGNLPLPGGYLELQDVKKQMLLVAGVSDYKENYRKHSLDGKFYKLNVIGEFSGIKAKKHYQEIHFYGKTRVLQMLFTSDSESLLAEATRPADILLLRERFGFE